MPSLPGWCCGFLCAAATAVHAAPAPIAVKVVIVTTFEQAYHDPAASGLTPGEAVAWIKGYHLDRVEPLTAGFRPVRFNADGVMETMTGMTTAKAAASTMALGLDPRFDFTHAYWILAGTAGIDPQAGSQGSAVWANWVVDGDIDSFIDPREAPANWPDGHVPWDSLSPFAPPGPNIGQVYRLQPALVDWAYQLTEHVPLPDNQAMRRFRSRFTGFPAAQQPPRVMRGDNLASATYWQGALGTQWARRWVKLYTAGAGTFATSSCEDSGFLQAITFLGHAGKVDPKRVLVLRVGSDYTVQQPGVSAAQSLDYASSAAYMAEKEACTAAFLTGRVVVDELVHRWDSQYRDHSP